nr:reverse transcriptase domain-containing protein [Tanacetum cinerariifolium]
MRQRRWLGLLSDYDCDIRYHSGKTNVVADALSRKERIEPLRVRALLMTIGLDLSKKILEAQIKALKLENLEKEDVGGMIRKDIPKEKLEPRADRTLCLNGIKHEEHLKAILEWLKKEKLYAKFSKCEFWIPNVQFLGHVIDSRGIHVDPAKIESIKDWASPKTPIE